MLFSAGGSHQHRDSDVGARDASRRTLLYIMSRFDFICYYDHAIAPANDPHSE